MLAKFESWFTSVHGWTLIALFLGSGWLAISSHFTGNVAADITVVVSALGLGTHPVA